MTYEELIQQPRPLAMELEYADEQAVETISQQEAQATLPTTDEATPAQTKKTLILALYDSGVTDIAQLSRRTSARPSYVAQILQSAGLLNGYFDLYTTTAREQNVYSKFFRNVLAFKSVEAARESIAKINRLYDYFERLGDRAGQHQAMVLALTGKNRARWSGKNDAAQVFGEWLAAH